MKNQALARRYATAIFQLAQEGKSVDRVATDLRAAADAVAGNEDVGRYYTSPVIQRSQKAEFITKAFGGKVDDVVLHVLLLLVNKRREALLGEIAGEFDAMVLAFKGLQPLDIVTARPLSKEELAAIVDRISKKYQQSFKLNYRVDPSLLAGMQVSIGDRYVDGSLSGRIESLARELFSQS